MNPLVKAALSSLAESGDFDRLLTNIATSIGSWPVTFGAPQLPDEAAVTAVELETYVLDCEKVATRDGGSVHAPGDSSMGARASPSEDLIVPAIAFVAQSGNMRKPP